MEMGGQGVWDELNLATVQQLSATRVPGVPAYWGHRDGSHHPAWVLWSWGSGGWRMEAPRSFSH